MRMSEAELQSLLEQNPNIKINDKSQPLKSSSKTPSSEETTKNQQNKYRNVKVYVYEDNKAVVEKIPDKKPAMVFDSIKEYKRWLDLLCLEKAGEISGLERQKNLVIQEAFKYQGKRISAIQYRADFYYIKDGSEVVEDVKPFDKKSEKHLSTSDFKLKWKLLKCKYPHIKFELY